MDVYPVMHSRPLPIGSLHHRSSHSFSDSSSSSFDQTAASPLAHKTAKRVEQVASPPIMEDEREVSFQLDKPSHQRDRSDDMKSLGLGWPSHFTTHPAYNKTTQSSDDSRISDASHEAVGLGFDAKSSGIRDAMPVPQPNDTESGKCSPPPAYGRASMEKGGNGDGLPVHTPPTQDIENGCSALANHEETVERMLDFPQSTMTRRRRAVEAAATAFGLKLESSPEIDRVSEGPVSLESDGRGIEQQLSELKRQLDTRDRDLALTARMAQAILRRHEDLVAALPLNIKALIPELHSIASIDFDPAPSPPIAKRNVSSPKLIRHPDLPSPPRSRSPANAHDARRVDHRRAKSALDVTIASSGLTFAEVRQQEADDRLAQMEQALADARDSEEAQRKNAARLSRDFHKLQRDYDRLEAQAVQAVGEGKSSIAYSPHIPASSVLELDRASRPLPSIDPSDSQSPVRPSRPTTRLSPLRDEDEVESACGHDQTGPDFVEGLDQYSEFPPQARSSLWQSPSKLGDSSATLSPYTAKPERPTVLRLRRLRAAQSKTTVTTPATHPVTQTPDRPLPSPLSRTAACPPAPRLGTLPTPQRDLRVASSRSGFGPPSSSSSLFSPTLAIERDASTSSRGSATKDENASSSPSTSAVLRGRRPRVEGVSSILTPPPQPRSWMKDYITASVRRRTRANESNLGTEVLSDRCNSEDGSSSHTCCPSGLEQEKSILELGSHALANGASQASGEEADDEAFERGQAGLISPARRVSSRRSQTIHDDLACELASRRQITFADTGPAKDGILQARRRLPKSPSPDKLSGSSALSRHQAVQTPTPRRGSRIKTSSQRSSRKSEQRSHPYLRPLALPLAQGLRTELPERSPALLRHRRPGMPDRPYSDTAVHGHRRRISSPGRELMLQIELRQREERHRRRVSRSIRRISEGEDEDVEGVISIPSKLINDLIILLGLVLEWFEVVLVIVYRVFVQARNGQRPNGGQRMWARRKRYYF